MRDLANIINDKVVSVMADRPTAIRAFNVLGTAKTLMENGDYAAAKQSVAALYDDLKVRVYGKQDYVPESRKVA